MGPSTKGPDGIVYASALGANVTDVDGNRYLDFAMGWCVGNLGWKHPSIEAAMQAFDLSNGLTVKLGVLGVGCN